MPSANEHSACCCLSIPDDGFNMGRMVGEGEEEEEEDEAIDHSEIQRRKERVEREQWLREQVWTFSCDLITGSQSNRPRFQFQVIQLSVDQHTVES